MSTITFGSAELVKTDVAPDAGYMQVSADFIVETKDDFSDYRFFFDFSGAIHEVEIKSKSQNVIPSIGGGARYNSGNLIAIPTNNLKDFSGKLTNPYSEEGRKLSEAISGGKIQGMTKLIRHSFHQTIKNEERVNWTYPTYQLEREEKTLKLTKLHDISPKISLEEEVQLNSRKYLIITIIAGILIALAILATGIFLFRKVVKKS